MPNIAQERVVVSDMYSSPKWKRRVNNMSDEQIHAIYMRQQERKYKKHADFEQLEFEI